MNVEIGAEAALFPEKKYINGIAVAVWQCGSVSKYFLLIILLLTAPPPLWRRDRNLFGGHQLQTFPHCSKPQQGTKRQKIERDWRA
jgi:hypothetical protein